MTSRNLYFKLMKEDLKSRLWAVSLVALALFFIFPVTAAFSAGSVRDAVDYEKAVLEYGENMLEWFSFTNGLTVFFMIATALVCGMSSFSYLYSRSKVDFYHSIPVKRERLYVVNFVDGILIVAVPYVIMTVLGVMLAISNGAPAGIWHTAFLAYGLHMVYYILMYSTVVIAVMMTGNLVVSFLGSLVFSVLIPAAITLVIAYFSAFFYTFVSWKYYFWVNGSGHFSPLTEYILQIGAYDGRTGISGLAVAGALAASAVLAVLGCFLYKKRPSEAAGRAMAFPVSRPIIRVALTMLAAMGVGLIFWSVRQSTGWAVFGILCGGIISHCVVEIIYHFDFKKLFSNWFQLVGCLAVSLFILLSFRYDLCGYDRYLPKEGQVKEAAVNVTALNDWTSYGNVEQSADGTYEWKSVGSGSYVFDHTHGGDAELVRAIAKAGIAETQRARSERAAQLRYRSINEWEEDGAVKTTVEIQYTLNSGRKVTRSYRLSTSDNWELFDALNKQEAFLEAMYPVLTMTADQTVGICYRELGPETRLDQLGAEENAELLKAYQQDLKELSLSQMQKEIPVGLIRFLTEEERDAIAWRTQQEQKAMLEGEHFYGYTEIDRINFYPVYASFTRTNQLLEQYGIRPGNALKESTVRNITLEYYDENIKYRGESEPYTQIVEDPEEIREILEAVRLGGMIYYNRMCGTEDGWSVQITYGESEKNIRTTGALFMKGQIPEFVQEGLTNSR